MYRLVQFRISYREDLTLYLRHLVVFKMFYKDVKKIHPVYKVTWGLFLLLLFHTFEVHGTLYSYGLTRYGYVLIQLNALDWLDLTYMHYCPFKTKK